MPRSRFGFRVVESVTAGRVVDVVLAENSARDCGGRVAARAHTHGLRVRQRCGKHLPCGMDIDITATGTHRGQCSLGCAETMRGRERDRGEI